MQVVDYDDRLELRNKTGKPLITVGYEGEPYLAFHDGRVYRNAHSPATYLNDDRFGNVALPKQANAKAPPEWQEVSPREEFDWHDHRIHWMSTTLPPRYKAPRTSRTTSSTGPYPLASTGNGSRSPARSTTSPLQTRSRSL